MSKYVSASCVVMALAVPALLSAQATYTATRAGDLQVGGGVVLGKSDYGDVKLLGGALYADFDRTPHLGAEFVIHQANSTGSDQSYQRTYELGLRYFRTYGPVVPYAKVMVGRGVFNYPIPFNPATNTYSGSSPANLAYNMYALGAGADLKVLSWLHLRGDYEYQSWLGFQGQGLKPSLITIGAAYHFPGELRGGR